VTFCVYANGTMSPRAVAWHRVPVAIRALIIGAIVAATATYPWAWLAAANMRHVPDVPWAAFVMAIYLCAYFWYVTGRGWPASTAMFRRSNARVRTVSGAAFGMAFLAGVFGLWSSVALLGLIRQLAHQPPPPPSDVVQLSPITVLSFVLMGSIVAGVVEEIAFRGYMQRPLERRYGPATAILVTGIVFGLAHSSHTYWSLVAMPYYLAVGAVYGTMAYLTDSVIPSLTLHAVGDALEGLFAVAAARPVVEPRSGAAAVVGGRLALIVNVIVVTVTAAAAICAFRGLASTVREERPEPHPPDELGEYST
jgi:membrane protease YdiL (CAAX protease family)